VAVIVLALRVDLAVVGVIVSHHCYPAAVEGERQCWPSR